MMTCEQVTTLRGTRSAECSWCGKPFAPTRPWSRFCGDPCRAANWRRSKEKENPPLVAAGLDGEQQSNAAHHSLLHHSLPQIRPNTKRLPLRIRRDTKLGRILTILATGRSLNRFEAERLGDHCLHSTISKIERHGIRVDRREENVPGFGGHKTRVMRYSLPEDERRRVIAILGLVED